MGIPGVCQVVDRQTDRTSILREYALEEWEQAVVRADEYASTTTPDMAKIDTAIDVGFILKGSRSVAIDVLGDTERSDRVKTYLQSRPFGVRDRIRIHLRYRPRLARRILSLSTSKP